MRPLRTHINYTSLDIIGIPKKFQSMTLEDFNTYDTEELEEVKGYMQEYINKFDTHKLYEINGILFYGSNGVGKTMLASLILKQAYIHRYSCKRMTFVDYISMYTKAWGSKSPQEREDLTYDLFVQAKGIEFLVLEEVGKEIDSKVAIPILEDLLRYREDKGLVTIMCTNVRPSVLEEKYGASIMSLMKGNMFPITIVGKDRRVANTGGRDEIS